MSYISNNYLMPYYYCTKLIFDQIVYVQIIEDIGSQSVSLYKHSRVNESGYLLYPKQEDKTLQLSYKP